MRRCHQCERTALEAEGEGGDDNGEIKDYRKYIVLPMSFCGCLNSERHSAMSIELPESLSKSTCEFVLTWKAPRAQASCS